MARFVSCYFFSNSVSKLIFLIDSAMVVSQRKIAYLFSSALMGKLLVFSFLFSYFFLILERHKPLLVHLSL